MQDRRVGVAAARVQNADAPHHQGVPFHAASRWSSHVLIIVNAPPLPTGDCPMSYGRVPGVSHEGLTLMGIHTGDSPEYPAGSTTCPLLDTVVVIGGKIPAYSAPRQTEAKTPDPQLTAF